MRIDCEMHVGKFKGDLYNWVNGEVTPRRMEKLLDEYALDMCILMAPTTDYPDNKGLARAIRKYPRFIAFAMVNPDGPGGGVPELERAVKDWGMRGLKLQPQRHGYEVDGNAPLRLMKCAEKLGIPVSIHSGTQGCLPWQIAHLAKKFPTVPVIVNHMGYRYYVDGAIYTAMETPNLYLDTVLVSMPGYLRMAVDKVGADRIVYGSDFPTGHPSSMIATLKAAGLSAKDEALVMGDNMARIMKIKSGKKRLAAQPHH